MRFLTYLVRNNVRCIIFHIGMTLFYHNGVDYYVHHNDNLYYPISYCLLTVLLFRHCFWTICLYMCVCLCMCMSVRTHAYTVSHTPTLHVHSSTVTLGTRQIVNSPTIWHVCLRQLAITFIQKLFL